MKTDIDTQCQFRALIGVLVSYNLGFIRLGDLVASVERETTVCVQGAVIVVLVVVPPSSTF
jgi:hypothetical protein